MSARLKFNITCREKIGPKKKKKKKSQIKTVRKLPETGVPAEEIERHVR